MTAILFVNDGTSFARLSQLRFLHPGNQRRLYTETLCAYNPRIEIRLYTETLCAYNPRIEMRHYALLQYVLEFAPQGERFRLEVVLLDAVRRLRQQRNFF